MYTYMYYRDIYIEREIYISISLYLYIDMYNCSLEMCGAITPPDPPRGQRSAASPGCPSLVSPEPLWPRYVYIYI